MPELRWSWSWLDAPGVKEPAEARTWALLGLSVDAVLATRVLDERLNTSRNEIFVSALPLVEWIVDAWPRMLHERRAPIGGQDADEWSGFHRIRAGVRGFPVPDLDFRRLNEHEMSISFRPDAGNLRPGIAVRFLSEGQFRLPVEHFEAEFARFVDATLLRIEALTGSRVERVRERWNFVRSQQGALVGRLGVDDENLDEDASKALHVLTQSPDSRNLVRIAEASSSATLSERVQDAEKLLEKLPPPDPGTATIKLLHGPVGGPVPWHTGWSAAAELRRETGLRSDESPGSQLEDWVEETFGWRRARQVVGLPGPVGGIETLHYRPITGNPSVLTSVRTRAARRFRLARSLFHLLFRAQPDGDWVAADSQLVPAALSEANAFAAEFLAPVDALRGLRPRSGVWTRSDVANATRTFGVDRRVIEHQIQNRALGAVEA